MGTTTEKMDDTLAYLPSPAETAAQEAPAEESVIMAMIHDWPELQRPNVQRAIRREHIIHANHRKYQEMTVSRLRIVEAYARSGMLSAIQYRASRLHIAPPDNQKEPH